MLTSTDLLVTTALPLFAALVTGVILSQLRNARQLAFMFSTAAGFLVGKAGLDARDLMTIQPLDLPLGQRLAAAMTSAFDKQLRLEQAQDWLVVLGLCSSLILGTLVVRKRRAAFHAVGFLIATVLALRLLWKSVYFVSDWSTAEAALRVFGIGCCVALPISLLTSDDDNPSANRALLPLLVWLGLLACSLTFLLTGSKTYGELGGVLSFAFLGTAGATLVCQRQLSLNDLQVVAILLGGLMLLACAFSSTPMWQVLMLGLGMTLSALMLGRKTENGKSTTRLFAVAVFLLAIVPVVGVAGWQFAEATKVDNPYAQYK